MSGYGQLELQQSIYQKLTADATLTALVTGVHDFVPQNTAMPYITLGEARISDWSTATTAGTACTVTLRVFSRQGGRKQAVTIMERLYALLHQANLTVTGQTAVICRFQSSEMRLENDGATYQGIMRLRVLLQGAA